MGIGADPDTLKLSELLTLLPRKQAADCPFSVQKEFYQKTCEFFNDHPNCIWCQYTPLSLEMLHLFSLPPNPLTELFQRITADCLSSCSNCINSYYMGRPVFFEGLSEKYEDGAMEAFKAKLQQWDIERLSSLLASHISGSSTLSSTKLLYGLFEILGFPLSIVNAELDGLFCEILHSLIASKKMLKVSKLMPGVVVLCFHKDIVVRQWAQSVLQGKLEPAASWNPSFVELGQVMEKASEYLLPEEFCKSAALVVRCVPDEEISLDLYALKPALASLDFKKPEAVVFLCVFLERLIAGVHTLGLLNFDANDFVAGLFDRLSLWTAVNELAVFPVEHVDALLKISHESAVTHWVRLVCNWACARLDDRMLDLVVANLLENMPKLSTVNARNNILSLLINIVHQCTASSELENEEFYVTSVRRTLEFLGRYFQQHANPHKPNPLLLETFKTCIQFDCNQVLLREAKPNNGSLLELITSLLVFFSGDRSVFDLMKGVCRRLFVEAKEKIIVYCLKSRLCYLDYLVRTWHLRGSEQSAEPSDIFMLILAFSFSKASSEEFRSSFTKENYVAIATAFGSWLKNAKVYEGAGGLFYAGLCGMGHYLDRIFVPIVFDRSGRSMLDSTSNSLYLKLHIVSSASAFISLVVSSINWNDRMAASGAFYSFAHSASVSISSLGLDTLKKCLRENIGMAKRFKGASQWISYLGKHASCMTPEQAKDLCAFVQYIVLVSITLNTPILEFEGQLKKFLSSFTLDAASSSLLKRAVQEYEAEFKVKINVQLAPPIPKTVSLELIESAGSIEDLFLQKLRDSAAEKPVRLPIAPINLKPMTKLEQLKQDLAKDMAPVQKTAAARKRVNAAVHHTAKAIKLENHADEVHSSDVEETAHQDIAGAFKDDLSNMGNWSGGNKEPSRSVKMIALEDASGADLATRPRKQEEEYVGVDPFAHLKRLQRYLLDLDIDDLDDRSLEGTNAKPIPDVFQSSQEYADVFEPLLLFECRSQLLQAKNEIDSLACFSAKVLSIANVDEYHEVTVGAEGDENCRLLSDHDYVMARLDQRDARSEIVGMVIQSSFKANRTEAIIKFKFKPHQHHYQVELRVGLVWKVKKLCNWVTSIREFNALLSIHDLRLCKAILNPRAAPMDLDSIRSVAEMLRESLELNASQAQAVAVSLNNPNPFTLIQGPPGTGKTKTILGLVGALFGRPYPALSSRLRPQRLLICAPSNAAIDEIVRRLKSGIYDCYHQSFFPKVIRLGSTEMIHEEVKDLTLDATIERTFNQSCKESLSLLNQQRDSLAELKSNLDFAEKMGRGEDVQRLKQELWLLKDAMKKNTGFIETTKQNVRNKVISEAQVVCSTLSSSGIELLSKLQFDVVIIDEACQAVEVSALIPLQYGAKHCILVGDPNQLPPTVISQAATVFSYEQSLFQRIQKANPDSVQLLSVQYRMHPEISVFPNHYFYGGRLTDDSAMPVVNARLWHHNPALPPYRFFDIHGQERNQARRSGDQGTSKSNELEAKACVALVSYLCSEARDINFAGKIGIVTPYKDQRRTLRREFKFRFGESILSSIEISTVDGYQGQEKEIIIFSCVRTCESRGIGFLNDARRLNVALTRAKCSLFILGRAEALMRNSLWRELIRDAQDRQCFQPYDNKFWNSIQHAKPLNLLPPVKPVEQKKEQKPVAAAAPLPASFKIKTPMQRKREAQAELLQPIKTKPRQ